MLLYYTLYVRRVYEFIPRGVTALSLKPITAVIPR